MRNLSLWLITAVFTFCVGVSSSLIFTLALAPDYVAMVMQQKTCEMHGAGMKMQKIPIVYGMRAEVGGYYKAREELFPNAKPSVSGGCVGGKRKHVEAWVCHKCREARLNWIRGHTWVREDEVAE